MSKKIPIHAGHSKRVVAFALVDDADYQRLAGHRWVMQGTPEDPVYIYRYYRRSEPDASARHMIGLVQDLLGHRGRVAFRNGCSLDCRRHNLITHLERDACIETGAATLRADAIVDPSSLGHAKLPLSRGWVAWIDPDLVDVLSRFRWVVAIRGRNVYASRRLRRSGGARTLYLARVIMGLQDMESGETLAAGMVSPQTPPSFEAQQLDLRHCNLVVTNRAGINLRRPTKQRYRGVRRQGQGYRASIKLEGQEKILGLFNTAEAAAQARDDEMRRLGLEGIVRLNDVSSEMD